MNNGQFYGMTATGGYQQFYRTLVSQAYADVQRQYASQQQQISKLITRLDMAEKATGDSLEKALAARKKAQGDDFGGNTLMGLLSTASKLKVQKQNLLRKAGAQQAKELELYFEQQEEIREKYQPRQSLREEIIDAVKQIPVGTGANTPAALDTFIDNNTGLVAEIDSLPALEKRVAIAFLNKRMQQERLLGNEAQYRSTFETKLKDEFKVLPADFDRASLRLAEQDELAELKKKKPSGLDTSKINTLQGQLDSAIRKASGESVVGQEEVIEVFTNRDLLGFLTTVNRNNGVYSDELLDAFADANDIDKQTLKSQFEEARTIYDESPEFVPTEFVKILDQGVQNRLQRQVRTQAAIDQLGDQEQVDLERLAAQRYIQSTPTPMFMYTREQRRDLKRGRRPEQVGTDVQVNNRSIAWSLKNDPEYSAYYESLTEGQQTMQQYRMLTETMFKELMVDPESDKLPTGRAEKKAYELFELQNTTGKTLTADELLRLTADAFPRNKDLQDNARAYYSALVMKQNTETQPSAEVSEALQESKLTPAVLPHSMFEFPIPRRGRERRQGRRDARAQEKQFRAGMGSMAPTDEELAARKILTGVGTPMDEQPIFEPEVEAGFLMDAFERYLQEEFRKGIKNDKKNKSPQSPEAIETEEVIPSDVLQQAELTDDYGL